MKKRILFMAGTALLCGFLLSSCFTYTSVVGEGAAGNTEVKRWNHYLIYGIVPVKKSNSQKMAKGAVNYEVTTQQTFFNGFLSAITGGIYTPTTTIVKR